MTIIMTISVSLATLSSHAYCYNSCCQNDTIDVTFSLLTRIDLIGLILFIFLISSYGNIYIYIIFYLFKESILSGGFIIIIFSISII